MLECQTKRNVMVVVEYIYDDLFITNNNKHKSFPIATAEYDYWFFSLNSQVCSTSNSS